MKRILGTLLALVCLTSFAARAHALELHHGLELQGGLGHWNEPESGVDGVDYRWRPVFGAGWFVDATASPSVRLGASLGYRRVGDEVRWSLNVGGTDYDSRIRESIDQLALPVRVEYALPFAPAFAIEAGGQAEYVLKVMERVELASFPAIRTRRPFAAIFEDSSKPFEVTAYSRRLGGAAIAGLSWRTVIFSRDAAISARWEQGLTELWKDSDSDLERRARRVSATLRMNW